MTTPFEAIDNALTALGFKPVITYQAIASNPNMGEGLRAGIMWENTTGTRIFQCASQTGPDDKGPFSSVLFWQNASDDLASQLADLMERTKGESTNAGLGPQPN